LPYDYAEQQQHGCRVHQQQRDHDVMGRRYRREVGENDEGDKGREQRKANGDGPQYPHFPALGGRSDEVGLGAGSLI
jgi:hypothetical protein